MLSCVFARAVWVAVLTTLSRPDWAPIQEDTIVDWFTACSPPRTHRRDVNTVLSLCLWELWKHRNKIVFEGASPSTAVVIMHIEAEGSAWSRAGMFKHDMASFLYVLSRWDDANM